MRKITCTNADNISITFGEAFSPFLLLNCDGIYSVENNVWLEERSLSDGADYLGSNTKLRNIVLTVADKDSHMSNRNLLYRLFKKGSKGVFTYYEIDDEEETTKEIDYYVETVSIDTEKRVRTAEISLLCPEPFFRAQYDENVLMTGWDNQFEFPHEFLEEKEELSTMVMEKLKTINNTSEMDGIGVTVTMTVEGNVLNPYIVHVEKNEWIKVGTELKPLNLIAGDQLIITTQNNDKNIYLIRDGMKSVINEYLDEDTEFFQFSTGSNTLRYGADDGENYLLVNVSFRHQFMGC